MRQPPQKKIIGLQRATCQAWAALQRQSSPPLTPYLLPLVLYPSLSLAEVNIAYFLIFKKTSFTFIETASAHVGNIFWRSISLFIKFLFFSGCLSTLLKWTLLECKVSPCLIHLASLIPVLEPRQTL